MMAEAVVVTRVWWDINRCPVPDGVDVSRVGPCIKGALEKVGCSGPVTITAIGLVSKVPHDLRRQVYSCGIGIHHVPTDISGIARAMLRWIWFNKPPANLMLISAEEVFLVILDGLEHRYKIVRSIFPDAPKQILTYPRSFLWESLLPSLRAMDSGAPQEDKCSQTGKPALHCSTCCLYDVQGFENFITHLESREHADQSQYYDNGEEEEEEEEDVEMEVDEIAIQRFQGIYLIGYHLSAKTPWLSIKKVICFEENFVPTSISVGCKHIWMVSGATNRPRARSCAVDINDCKFAARRYKNFKVKTMMLKILSS